MKLLVVLSVIVMAGCGRQDSNPSRNYPDVQGVKSFKDTTRPPVYGTSSFHVEVMGSGDNNVGHFIEGQSDSISILVQPLKPEIKDYTLELISKPDGARLERSTQDPRVFIMKWTPSKGLVDRQQGGRRYSLEFQAKPLPPTPAELLYIVSPVQKFPIVVTATITDLVASVNIAEVMEEGQLVPFTIDVKDPANRGVVPSIARASFDTEDNNELFKADATSYVVAGEPRYSKIKGGYRYNFAIDLSSRPAPKHKVRGQVDSNADKVEACLVFKAFIGSEAQSAATPACFTVKYSAQKPLITFENGFGDETITAGQSKSIKFSAKTDKGQVALKLTPQDMGNWPGNPTIECSDAKQAPSDRQCEVKWNVPCGVKLKDKYTMSVSATNVFNDQKKSTDVAKNFTVSVPEECKPVQQVASRKEGAKK